ncbi:MAG: hypothetical protein ACR2PF_05310, partial [Rhizobiaceae bacterium]
MTGRRVAIEPGMMLGSQERCELSFGPVAVNRYIEAKVPDFASSTRFPTSARSLPRTPTTG